jgi:hypothetical protein
MVRHLLYNIRWNDWSTWATWGGNESKTIMCYLSFCSNQNKHENVLLGHQMIDF